MRLIVTGGGTGGHVFPALEIARAAREEGIDVRYLGSLRGQEGRACQRLGLPFEAFPSGPVRSLRSPRGWASLVRLVVCAARVRRRLRALRPDAVFGTGGYAAAPVILAARKLGVPYVIHEQNAIPGRANRLAARRAAAVATVFRAAERHFPGGRVVRTGMPLRRELRSGQQGRFGFGAGEPGAGPLLLVMGGSQGAEALNDAALATAVRMAGHDVAWLHVTGPAHFERVLNTKDRFAIRGSYEVRAYLEAEEMAAALFSARLVICRAGAGTLAELAAFRRPAILVPYPYAYAGHQMANAREFESLGAASVLSQTELQPRTLEGLIEVWLSEPEREERARIALAEWDVPDAVERVLGLLREAAGNR